MNEVFLIDPWDSMSPNTSSVGRCPHEDQLLIPGAGLLIQSVVGSNGRCGMEVEVNESVGSRNGEQVAGKSSKASCSRPIEVKS